MTTLLYTHPSSLEHDTGPGHPERPERLVAISRMLETVARTERGRDLQTVPARDATDDELRRVHRPEHVALVAATARRDRFAFDADTPVCSRSFAAARRAAGGALSLVDSVMAGEIANGFAFVRPPGHHAEPDRAMGFCLYNNIAIAAAALRAEGVSKVAIVDIDVHHGNGTQAAFYADPSVLFISSHQYPYYPGTCAATETGSGPGTGYTLNLPLEAGATDEDYARVYESHVVPALDAYQPEVILVSAGYDAHARDPLAGMRMTTEGYAQLVRLLDDAARRLCGRRLALVTEGGYHLEALRDCLAATIDVIN